MAQSVALPFAFVLLRILIVLNWLAGAAIAALLLLLPHTDWIMAAFKLTPSPEADLLLMGLRAIAVVGLISIPINHLILARLLAMVRTVRGGDPFVASNAQRLQTIAWALLALQCLGILIYAIALGVSTPAHLLKFETSASLTGWLAVLLTFILARVFAAGSAMRADLEGTV